MNRILWISRRDAAPLPKQIQALKAMYGADCEVAHRDIPNSGAVAAEFRSGGYADIVCVVPLATLDHICREGLTPLYAEMVETGEGEPDLAVRGRRFWFQGFKRVKGVSLDLAEPRPIPGKMHVHRLTRHAAQPEEIAAIKRLYGQSTEVTTDSRPFNDGREAEGRLRQSGASDLLIMAPYSVIDQVVKAGRSPLWAEVVDGRFRKLWRVQSVRIEFDK